MNQALKSFARVALAAGETKTVTVELPWRSFEIVNAAGQPVVEPGEFDIRVGPSSRMADHLVTRVKVPASVS